MAPPQLGRALRLLGKMADSRAKSGKAENELEPSWKPERKEMIKGHWEHIKKYSSQLEGAPTGQI